MTEHFTLSEFIRSETASRRGIDNNPPGHVLDDIKRTLLMAEEIRKAIGNVPLIISSGYRSPMVNRAVGGSSSSQHCLGQAMDIIAPKFGTPWELAKKIIDSGIEFDQLIYEFGDWVHISKADYNRKQVLTIRNKRQGYIHGLVQI